MAGNGELRNEIIECCARYGISDRFHFKGFLDGQYVAEVLHQSDVLLMPSVSEPFGIVPLEAMQFNVPVIISLQSGVAELIKCVIKTDFWDVHAMADAVIGILKYKKLSNVLAREGKNEVNQLSWETVAREIRKVYQNTLFSVCPQSRRFIVIFLPKIFFAGFPFLISCNNICLSSFLSIFVGLLQFHPSKFDFWTQFPHVPVFLATLC